MKKKNKSTIVWTAGVIALLSGMFYLGGKNVAAPPATLAPVAVSPATADHHGNTANASISIEPLNALAGKSTPSFSLADRDGNVYSPENLRGKNVVLFFNEGLMCYPACWNQIVALAKDARFNENNTVVLSIVVDDKNDWQKAIAKMPDLARATVAFDTGSAASKKFQALTTPSSMHPGSFPGHTYLLIDAEGTVRFVLDDPAMAIHNDHLIDEIKKLNG